MKKLFPIVGSISALIIALSVAYYFIIFLPDKEKARQQIETQKIQIEQEQKVEEEAEESERKRNLLKCLSLVAESRKAWWEKECKALGRKDDCLLPQYNANRIDEQTNIEKDRCYQLYPAD